MSRSLRLCCLAFVLAVSLAAVDAQEEKMKVTEEQAYAPITYDDGSSIDFQDKTLLNLTLAQNLGVWKAEGAQVPRGEFENPEGAMPKCNASNADQFSFQHNVNDDQYLIFTAAPGGALQTSSGHRQTSQSNVTGYNTNILNLNSGGEAFCQTWYPYLDRNTGLLKARTIYNGVYSMGAGGAVNYTSLNCNATEPVIPGCFNEMGEGGSMTVRAASVFTWVCQQGECATQSPLFSQYDLAHPVDE